MATIVKNKQLSVDWLPVEILHRILDHLDGQTILLSIRYVSKQFQTVTNNYNKYKLNFSSILKTQFRLICRIIQPEDVISLTLSNGEKTPNQIDLFPSVFDINRWTRLRSLTLLDIDNNSLKIFLLHTLAFCTLISLSIKCREIADMETLAHLSSFISQPNLHRLDLSDNYILDINKIQWLSNCTLHYFQINDCSFEQFCTILDNSPVLRTFVLQNGISNNLGGIQILFSINFIVIE